MLAKWVIGDPVSFKRRGHAGRFEGNITAIHGNEVSIRLKGKKGTVIAVDQDSADVQYGRAHKSQKHVKAPVDPEKKRRDALAEMSVSAAESKPVQPEMLKEWYIEKSDYVQTMAEPLEHEHYFNYRKEGDKYRWWFSGDDKTAFRFVTGKELVERVKAAKLLGFKVLVAGERI